MKQHFNKLAMIIVLGSGFALAQNMPQTSPQNPPSTTPQSSPSTLPQQPSSTDPQQPSTAPDQGKNPASTPEQLPNTDQKKDDQSKMPQSDAAASGDVQGNIQSALQKDSSLANASVNVAVNGKTVELSGTVPTKDAKDSAERIAKENANGMKIKNHIKVAAADKSMDKSAPPQPMSNPK